jgi:NAD(P)-dependent dehydrogenase (short-subunit alcohol dehydrogenase family)
MSLLLPETASSAMARSTFQDKSILITGASGGLGRALALQFSTCHPKTLVLSARDEATLTEVAQQCQVISPTTKIHTLVCDLSNLEEVKQLGEQACQLVGQDGALPVIDVLVNNGGLSSRSKFLDTTIEIDELLMRVNYLAGASLAKQCVPGMVQQQQQQQQQQQHQQQEEQQSSSTIGGGKLIWISSVQGLGKLAKAKFLLLLFDRQLLLRSVYLCS